MRGPRMQWLGLAAAAAALAAIAVIAFGDGDGGPTPRSEEPLEEVAPEPGHEHRHEGPEEPAADQDPVREPPPLDEDRLSPAQREAARVVRSYIEGLDARDGRAVCHLLAPGAIDEVELPRRRGGCARSLRASIGYRDPRGFPVWDSVSVQGLLTVAHDGERASVTVTTLTRFADRAQPSIEDDVVHLVRRGGRWQIAKPSSTVYRAVGIPDVPPRVLAPPE